MEIHLVKEFIKFATAFFTFRCRVIVHFLQYLNNFFAFFTLVFINGHDNASNSYVYLYIIYRFLKISIFWSIFGRKSPGLTLAIIAPEYIQCF